MIKRKRGRPPKVIFPHVSYTSSAQPYHDAQSDRDDEPLKPHITPMPSSSSHTNLNASNAAGLDLLSYSTNGSQSTLSEEIALEPSHSPITDVDVAVVKQENPTTSPVPSNLKEEDYLDMVFHASANRLYCRLCV